MLLLLQSGARGARVKSLCSLILQVKSLFINFMFFFFKLIRPLISKLKMHHLINHTLFNLISNVDKLLNLNSKKKKKLQLIVDKQIIG